MSDAALRALEGKTIASGSIETVKGDEVYQCLVLRFEDGSLFSARSQDADGYQSWLDYSFARERGET